MYQQKVSENNILLEIYKDLISQVTLTSLQVYYD